MGRQCGETMDWEIPLYKVFWDSDDVRSVTDIIKTGMFWAGGPNIKEFESMVADYVGAKYAVAFNSGTSALHAVLLAYDIGKDDEVIVPSFTFIATPNSVLFTGARPIFGDVDEETYGLDPDDVLERISNKSKVIMPIHYGGLPCKISELKEIAEDHNLLLIEDAAESIGAHVRGKKVGSFGDSAMFSFCGNKVITTGEGGMIVTNSRDICEKMKLLRSHGRLETKDYFATSTWLDHVTLGFNWRISSITAALGISQMKKLDMAIKKRRENAEYMTKKLSKIDEVTCPSQPPGYYHIFQMYTIKAKNRDELQNHLTEKRIMTKIYFQLAHLTEFYRKTFKYEAGELPVSEKLTNQVLTLPMFPNLTNENMDYIFDAIKSFYKK